MRYKLEKLLETRVVIYHSGSFRDLYRHPIVAELNRTVIALESENP